MLSNADNVIYYRFCYKILSGFLFLYPNDLKEFLIFLRFGLSGEGNYGLGRGMWGRGGGSNGRGSIIVLRILFIVARNNCLMRVSLYRFRSADLQDNTIIKIMLPNCLVFCISEYIMSSLTSSKIGHITFYD